MINHGQKNSGKHIQRVELFAENEVDAYRYDYRIAYHTDLTEQLSLKNSAQGARKQSYTALINQQRNKCKYNSVSERCAENNRRYKVERTFNKKHGAVARQAVI